MVMTGMMIAVGVVVESAGWFLNAGYRVVFI